MSCAVKESVWAECLGLDDSDSWVGLCCLDKSVKPSLSNPSVRIEEYDVVPASLANEEIVCSCEAEIRVRRAIVVNENLIVASVLPDAF